MAKKAWRGDDEHRLPAQKVEPYRLWFEFLKLALRDPEIRVNKKHYRRWGAVENLTFNEWWSSNWRDLFAVDIGVRVCQSGEAIESGSDKELILRVPLYQSKARTLKQLSELLNAHGAGERLADMKQGEFRLSSGFTDDNRPIHPSTRFLRNLPKVRLMMHLYRFWLEGGELSERDRLEHAAKSYFNWTSTWNSKIRAKGKTAKREIRDLPIAVTEYVEFLKKRGPRRWIARGEINDSDVSNHRRQIARYIRKARRIAENVARGEFPGVYE